MFNSVSRAIVHKDPVGWCDKCQRDGRDLKTRNGVIILAYEGTYLGPCPPGKLCAECFVKFREAGESRRPVPLGGTSRPAPVDD